MLEVHLMIERPERQLGEFATAGADSITFHAEATPHLDYAPPRSASSGRGVGLAINPATPLGVLASWPRAIDLALCMTVNPGWGGQPFIEHSLRQARAACAALVGAEVAVEVDGGIDPETAPALPRGRGQRVRRRLGDLRPRRPGRGLRRDRDAVGALTGIAADDREPGGRAASSSSASRPAAPA